MERKIIYLDDAIDALRYAQHRFTVADEAGGMGTVKWSEDVIYFATAERVLAELPSAQPEPCDDAVSRNAIIRKLNTMDRYVSEELTLCDTDKKFPKNEVFIVDDVYEEIVEQLPSAQPEQQWIPCSERLPEVGKDVMVCYDFKGHRSVLIGVLYGDEKFHGYDDEYLTPEGRKYRKAVAWMPLPKPYREGEQDE